MLKEFRWKYTSKTRVCWHVCRITWMTMPIIVQITLASGRLWRTKQEWKEVTSAYRKWWTRGFYRWDIRLSQSTSTDRVELPKFHKNIFWWMTQKSLILNTLHHLGKTDANYIAEWNWSHLCMGFLYFNSSYFKSKPILFNYNHRNVHFFLFKQFATNGLCPLHTQQM